jgi:predicted dehydrogenase
MFNVIIYGAGSIGNHLAHACRNKDWNVTICDLDPEALERTKNEIYPERYSTWDKKIQLVTPDLLPTVSFDLAIIGTPPDSHIPIALEILGKNPPRVLLIEKPLCTPSLTDCVKLQKLAVDAGTTVCVGYNHTLTQQSKRAGEIVKSGFIGKPLTIHGKVREHWGGIFRAHPWLSGPSDTYLGFWEKGGGACGEHSHGINIWQHFSGLLGMGKIVEVSAMMDMVNDGGASYDQICQLNVKTEKTLVGSIVQDVITNPTQKSLRVQGEGGFLEWYVNLDAKHDALRYSGGDSQVNEELFPKVRPDDFVGEIDHVQDILEGKSEESPISLERGLETMLVIAAAYKSSMLNRTVKIDYAADCSPEAIHVI